jgi:RNA polymerase sigma-70 factor (ECF subfamily)
MNAAGICFQPGLQANPVVPQAFLMATPARDGARSSADDLNRLLLAVASAQDRQAFASLFKHFAPRVKSYVMRSGLASSVAEEIAQATMLAVWRKASFFDPARAGAATWIFTIARNLRIDHQRRERAPETLAPDASGEAEPPPSGEALMIAAERETRVRDALGSLSEEQALIVRLSFFSEKPHAEIARELGIPLGTVKSRARLALARLRNLLDDVL